MTVYTRAQWGASPPRPGGATPWPGGMPNSLTVHAVGGTVGEQDNYLPVIKSIQNHAFSKGLSDIDYNYLVDYRGNIYEGRTGNYQSGAQGVGNGSSIAVCYLDYGDGDVPFTNEAKAAILYLAGGRPIRPHRSWNDANTQAGHSQYVTSCPGDEISAWCASPSSTVTSSGELAVTPQEIQSIADAVNTVVGNRVIATLQTNMKQEWIPQIIAGLKATQPAGSVDVTTLADKVADEFSKRLAINL